MTSIEANATDVIDKIRRKEFISPAICRQFFSPEKADSLRRLVRDDDLDSVLSFIYRAAHDDVFRLGNHVLQGLSMYSGDAGVKLRVRGILEGLWAGARESVTRGTSVCFGLLNVEDISVDMHEVLFQFYLDTWDYQCENQREWSGGAERVVAKVKQRLVDARFPPSKRWIYILALGASNSTHTAEDVLKSLESEPDLLVQRSIIEVRQRLPRQ